jgi:hypothetical protein
MHLRSNGVSTSTISLLSNCQLNTLALRKRNPWLLSTDDENVVLTGSKGVVYGILDVDNVETSVVTLTVSDDTYTTHVTTTSDHCDHTGIELDEVGNLSCGKINLDSVVDLDRWVWVTDTTRRGILSAFLCHKFSSRQPKLQSRWIDQSLDQRLNDV